MNVLDARFNEKIANKKIPELIKKEVKKKKKDIIKEDIETRELQYYESSIVDDIKIYNGVIRDEKQKILDNIEFFKHISPSDKLTDITPSTLTANGNISNINFNEEDFISKLPIPSVKNNIILKVGCNYGEIYTYPNPYVDHNISVMLQSIIALNGKNIKIGCSCGKINLDIPTIHKIALQIVNNSEKFTEIFNTIKNILDEEGYKKKKITTLMKNFGDFLQYNLSDEFEIEQIYTIIEVCIKHEQDFCYEFLDNIKKIITIFKIQLNVCNCSQKIQNIKMNDIDKKAAKKMNTNYKNVGRKKKVTKAKRKAQGTGLYFNSQITFDVFNINTNKIIKIKIFRNGNFQVPGVKYPNMSDIIPLLKNLVEYLNGIHTTPVNITYLFSIMRNYICKLQNPDVTIILTKLADVFQYEKTMEHIKSFAKYDNIIKTYDIPKDVVHDIFKYCNKSLYQISEILINTERYPGLLIKFNKPIPGDDNKKLTIKILSSGKINFDGATSELEIIEIYHWLQYMFNKYWDEIIYDPRNIICDISSDSCTEYESIYDEDL